MARLPNHDRAVVPEAKLTQYLLSHTHPAGRAKARFLGRFGFRADRWQELRDALLAHAVANDVALARTTPFGAKFEIDGPLLAPDGRAPIVLVIWFIEAGDDAPRLVTLIPRRSTTP